MTQWRKNTQRTINHCARHCTLIYIISHNFCSFSLIGLLRGVREQIPSPLFLGRRAVICPLSGAPSTSPFSCHQRLLSPQNMARPDTTTHSVWKRRCSQQSSGTLIFIISLCTLFFFFSFCFFWMAVGGRLQCSCFFPIGCVIEGSSPDATHSSSGDLTVAENLPLPLEATPKSPLVIDKWMD